MFIISRPGHVTDTSLIPNLPDILPACVDENWTVVPEISRLPNLLEPVTDCEVCDAPTGTNDWLSTTGTDGVSLGSMVSRRSSTFRVCDKRI